MDVIVLIILNVFRLKKNSSHLKQKSTVATSEKTLKEKKNHWTIDGQGKVFTE